MQGRLGFVPGAHKEGERIGGSYLPIGTKPLFPQMGEALPVPEGREGPVTGDSKSKQGNNLSETV